MKELRIEYSKLFISKKDQQSLESIKISSSLKKNPITRKPMKDCQINAASQATVVAAKVTAIVAEQ